MIIRSNILNDLYFNMKLKEALWKYNILLIT